MKDFLYRLLGWAVPPGVGENSEPDAEQPQPVIYVPGDRVVVENRFVRHQRDIFVTTMAEFFAVNGCTDIYVDAPDYNKPLVIEGSVRNHVPALTARYADSSGTPIILDTMFTEGAEEDSVADVVSRLQLFASAVRALDGELHIVVPTWLPTNPEWLPDGPSNSSGVLGEEVVKSLLDRLDLTAHKIWSL